MDTVKPKNALATFLIVFGIAIFYVMQMSTSPILLTISEHYGITNDMLLNLTVDIIFVTIVIGCVTGTGIERRIGTRKLYTLAMAFVVAGSIVLALCASSYALLLVGRALFGLGFGFGVPFIGSAIMRWYSPRQREKMNTINGIFPFVGTSICFAAVAPLGELLGNHWELGLAAWGLPVLIVMTIWAFAIKDDSLTEYEDEENSATAEKHMYRSLWSRREIRLLCVTFVCDFSCYSYVGTILPTLLFEAGDMPETMTNFVAAVAFPFVGLIGSVVAGAILARTGLRKPLLVIGQILKFIGLTLATTCTSISLVLIVAGIAIFGFGNAFWMPSMYCVPMDLKGMTPVQAGGAFAMLTAVGLAFGFIAPMLGGWMTGVFMDLSSAASAVEAHVFGLAVSLFIFGCLNIIGTICMLRMPETGEKRTH